MYHISGEYIEEEDNKIPHQYSREKNSCRLNIRGRNPHPSETEPRIQCQEYNPIFCRKNKVNICHNEDPKNVMINVGKYGNLEISHLQGDELIKRTYKWNRLLPLQRPVTNNVHDFIQDNAWDNRFS